MCLVVSPRDRRTRCSMYPVVFHLEDRLEATDADYISLFLGVLVGQVDINQGDDVHTGVTVILPRGIKDTIYKPCYAAVHHMNTAGEWTGVHQIREWGYSRAVCISLILSKVICILIFANDEAYCVYYYYVHWEGL